MLTDMKISKMRMPIENILWYSGFFVLLLSKFARIISMLESTMLATKLVEFSGIILVLLAAFRRCNLFTIVFVAYGVFSYLISQDTTLFIFLLLINSIPNRNPRKVINFYFYVQALVLLLCIIAHIGFLAIGNSDVVMSYIDGRVRHNFLFAHPNNFGVQVAYTVMAYLYLKEKNIISLKGYILLIMNVIFLLVFPASRTAAIALINYGLILTVMKYHKFIRKFMVKIFMPLIIMGVGIVVYLFVNGQEHYVSSFITGTFASRFMGARMAFDLYDLNLFGNQIDNLGKTLLVNGQWGKFWLDLAYVRMIIAFGIVGTVVFFCIFYRSLRYYILNWEYQIIALLLTTLLYAVSEWTAFSIMTVFPLLFLYVGIPGKMKNIKIKIKL